MLRDVSLNSQQQDAIEAILRFLEGPSDCFILRGCAGTGKTTLIRELIKSLAELKTDFRLIAPTGRAARILGAKTSGRSKTIHSVIYTLSDVEVFESAEQSNDPGLRWYFPLNTDDPGKTLFIADEASMVGDKESEQDLLRFGSGRLLADLIEYARLGRKGRSHASDARILFVGDPAQLPPVGEKSSPALSSSYLRNTFSLRCDQFELTEVMRQQSGSAILERATALRDSISQKSFNAFKLSPEGDKIVASTITDGVKQVVEALKERSPCPVLVTWSNPQALELNRAVRGRLWDDEEKHLQAGDLLLVNKNAPGKELYNGDLVKVIDVAPEVESRLVPIKGLAKPVGLKFRQVTIAYREADGSIRCEQCRIIENLLDSRERDLTPTEQRALLVDFRQRNPDLRPRTAEFLLAIKDDPWFNALQVKYGYAMTCHKAQGGEWDTAIVDFTDNRGKRNEDFFRWAYTAVTRAKLKLITISAPHFDPYSNLDWGKNQAEGENAGTVQKGEAVNVADSDWDRFSFSAGKEVIFGHHQLLREAWKSAGIQITGLDHLQYCERYHLERSGKQANVQYWYKGNQRVSRMEVLPAHSNSLTLVEEALAIMRDVLRNGKKDNVASETDFVRAFRQRVEQAIVDDDIQLITIQPMQYRLRMEFADGNHQAKIDFHYDGTPKWTRVEEVGGAGRSHGLIDSVRALLESNQR